MTDDRTAIAMVKSGNTDAYSLLVEKYQTPLYRIALAILHDPHETEDVLQDAFIQGYLRLDSLRSPEKYYPWMVQIVKKRCFNVLARTKRTESAELHAEYIEALSDDTPTPEEITVTDEEKNSVERAIDSLPPQLRETARLFFLHGIKQTQIAMHLGVPVGTVKRRIHDAKLKLRKELDTMNNTNTQKPADNFALRVAEKIAELENYNTIHGSNVGFEAAYRDTLNLIGELSDKNEAASMEAKAVKAAYRTDEEKYADEALGIGVKTNDPLILADAYITKWNEMNGGDRESMEYIAGTVVPALRALPDSNEKFAALGRILFWLYAHTVREKLGEEVPKEAEEYLKESKDLLLRYAHLIPDHEDCGNIEHLYYTNPKSYYLSMEACALAGEIGLDRLKNPRFRKNNSFLNITSQGWIKKNGNLKLEYQPGFTMGKSEPLSRYADAIFYYAACSGDGWFFPHTRKIGESEVVKKAYGGGEVIQSIVSDSESVMTPAGVFKNCLHIRKTNDRATYDIWYADQVGIVRFDDSTGNTSAPSSYLLSEYKIEGGDGYLPLALGNRWQYTNVTAPDGIEGTCDYTVVRNDENFVYLTEVCESGILADTPDDSPEIIFANAGKLVEDDNCDNNDYDSYAKEMEKIVVANKTRESVEIALNVLDYLMERKIYGDKNYRFLPSSCNMSTLTRKNGTITYGEGEVHSVSTGRWGTRGDAENRIFGVKLFRYPYNNLGGIWKDEWKPGFTETKKHHWWKDEEITLTVTEGGTVTTKAGTFENCLKLTMTCESEGKEGHYYFFSYTNCGLKEYWYAPGVGIVYHRCKWGPCESECELVDYNTVSKDGEYMPIHIGNRWSYEEKNLTAEGYVARRDYAIVSGINNTYLLRDNQMFVYLGTEEEYEEWKKTLG